jgi:hypothetical protein
MFQNPFTDISNISYTEHSAATTMHRLVLSIGYRFQRCAINIDQVPTDFKPSPDLMSLAELLHHIAELIHHCRNKLGSLKDGEPSAEPAQILTAIDALQALVTDVATAQLGDDFYYLINGPLSDALTHIGQINVYKRLAGITAPNGNYYKGQPAKSDV